MENFQLGQKIFHNEYGDGVIVSLPSNGFIRAFFSVGERQVSVSSISLALTRSERIVQNCLGNETRALGAWLSYQAYFLPLLSNASTLTAAKIDLLPHQVVITHRIATSSPRRFLVADEVGLGKTIETALILRELLSRGELKRALMIVPAGLVNNWHRELNEVFNLNFEVFGREGDVNDRRSNAFEKHDFLIASIDTLKQKARIKRLKDSPMWDLIVFDEAHHLTATRRTGKLYKTENYKLAEVLRDRTRDLLLLSATPHQGDHFRFWMLVQLLNPVLFQDVKEMQENRHRLNSVIFRRTKADACRPDGSTLFARRSVHTESFIMSNEENAFYNELVNYLADGFDLAKRQGNKGRALGFVMTIFQKIAASSFAAVHRTLHRRLIALTIQEGIVLDNNLDIEGRERAFAEAREIIRSEYDLGIGRQDDFEVDRILADLKSMLLKKMDEDQLALASMQTTSELVISLVEDAVAQAVEFALPEERNRIKKLLQRYPTQTETKVKKLLDALGFLWRQDVNERVVVFATYLGSVEMLAKEIENTYPGQGVAVLKGGDHSAKVAAERRFRKADGPKVMICTAAGREGINLQFARILFNFDLPWNPMDIEQRIGRIHRYGQKHTAQVYNLVLSDTIEGKIFLLLDDKLQEIARTLGKVDEQGTVAEDFKTQILGQLSERLGYDKLYMDALRDPELHRTKVELAHAMSNATEARKVVFELFQELDRFDLDEYKSFSGVEDGMNQIFNFVECAAKLDGKKVSKIDEHIYQIRGGSGIIEISFSTSRDRLKDNDNIQLLGLDNPLVTSYLERYRGLNPELIGIRVKSVDKYKGILSLWYIEVQGERRQARAHVIPLAVDSDGQRVINWERNIDSIFTLTPVPEANKFNKNMLHEILEPMLLRELVHRGLIGEKGGYMAELIGYVEIV